MLTRRNPFMKLSTVLSNHLQDLGINGYTYINYFTEVVGRLNWSFLFPGQDSQPYK